MSKMIQIRNVPDDIHKRLKVKAAEAGMTLSDFLLKNVRRLAERPTREELRRMLATIEPFNLDESAAQIIRRMRDGR